MSLACAEQSNCDTHRAPYRFIIPCSDIRAGLSYSKAASSLLRKKSSSQKRYNQERIRFQSDSVGRLTS